MRGDVCGARHVEELDANVPLGEPAADEHAAARVGAELGDAVRVRGRLDRVEEVEVGKVVHVDAVLEHDHHTLSAHTHRLDLGAEGELAYATVLVVVPDHHLRGGGDEEEVGWVGGGV